MDEDEKKTPLANTTLTYQGLLYLSLRETTDTAGQARRRLGICPSCLRGGDYTTLLWWILHASQKHESALVGRRTCIRQRMEGPLGAGRFRLGNVLGILG